MGNSLLKIEISYRKAKNIEWIYSAQDREALQLQAESDTLSIVKDLIRQLFYSYEFSIVEIAQIVEDKFLLGKGIGLLLFKSLVLDKKIYINLNERLNLNVKKVAVTITA
ncbi:MAG: TnsA endonuclease C-terminal domain-containing protein [Thermincola sp.]|nr:TnsA endonuclease C-terminal domain-containing protein [Thermincola sp.]